MHDLTWGQLSIVLIAFIIIAITWLVYSYRVDRKLIHMEEEIERIEDIVEALAAVQESEAMGGVHQSLSEDQQPCTPPQHSDHLPPPRRTGTSRQYNFRDKPRRIREDRCTDTQPNSPEDFKWSNPFQNRGSNIKK